MKLSIDRFENDTAVCQSDERETISIPRALLPENAREGDMLELSPDGSVAILPDETALRRKSAAERLKRLAKE